MSEIAIKDRSDNSVVGVVQRAARFVDLPNGDRVFSTKPGWENDRYRFVRVVRVDPNPPNEFHHRGAETRVLDGDSTYTITQEWIPFTQAEIDAANDAQVERELNRLLAGKLGKVLLALARGPHRPDLTAAQLRSFIKTL